MQSCLFETREQKEEIILQQREKKKLNRKHIGRVETRLYVD